MSLKDEDLNQRRIGFAMMIIAAALVILTFYAMLNWAGVF